MRIGNRAALTKLRPLNEHPPVRTFETKLVPVQHESRRRLFQFSKTDGRRDREIACAESATRIQVVLSRRDDVSVTTFPLALVDTRRLDSPRSYEVRGG